MKYNTQNKIINDHTKVSGSRGAGRGPLQIRRAGGTNPKAISTRVRASRVTKPTGRGGIAVHFQKSSTRRGEAGCETLRGGPAGHQNFLPRTSLMAYTSSLFERYRRVFKIIQPTPAESRCGLYGLSKSQF